MMKKIRLAIVISHPIQHYVFLYRALHACKEIELKVFFCSNIGVNEYFDKDMGVNIKWNANLLDGYEYQFLPEASSIKKTGFKSINNPSIHSALKAFMPDVVKLHGYGQMTMLRALFWCKLHRVPVLMWSDSSLNFVRSFWKRALKQLALRMLFSQFNAFLTVGESNKAYLKNYGVLERKLFKVPFSVDEQLLEKARQTMLTDKNVWRHKFEIPEQGFVVLFVGKLVPWKRAADIIEAFKMISQNQPEQTQRLFAVFAGDGHLKQELVAFAEQEHIPHKFLGFINIDQLPYVYAMSDVLVFSSFREAYGLAAKEAICVGLPVIASDGVGCIGTNDAIQPGINGLAYPCGNSEALANAILQLAGDKALYQQMSQASLRIADELSVKHSVQGFLQALRTVTHSGQTV